MVFLLSLAAFVLGAILASFIGVVAVRLHTGQSFLKGRSHCDACDATLNPKALMPIISFCVTRGRAECCGARISVWSPISEAVLGALFVLTFLKLGLTLALFAAFISLALLLALVLYDLAHQILPPTLLIPFILTSAFTNFLVKGFGLAFLEQILVAIALATILALIHLFSGGRAMGLADAPLTLGLALLVGNTSVSGFVFSFWIGAVVGIVVLLKRPPGSRMGIEVPFAPFLACGFLLAYFTQWNPFALITAFIH